MSLYLDAPIRARGLLMPSFVSAMWLKHFQDTARINVDYLSNEGNHFIFALELLLVHPCVASSFSKA